MANGAPTPKRKPEDLVAAMQQEMAARGPYDELMEIPNFSLTLMRAGEGIWAVIVDTPQRKRIVLPMNDEQKDAFNDLLTRSKIDVGGLEVPPNLRAPGQ